MIDPELVAKIRLLFFAEHWKIGTISIGVNAVVRSAEQVRLKYSVAAVSPPVRMFWVPGEPESVA
jgi:hypothetical protein